MADIRQKFTNAQSVTITLASLGNAATALSNAIDNSANKFVSMLLQLKIKTGSSGAGATGYIKVYLVTSADGGTTYDDSNANAILLGTFSLTANSTTYIFSMDTGALGITLPDYFKILVDNETGTTLDGTAGNHSAKFLGKIFETA